MTARLLIALFVALAASVGDRAEAYVPGPETTVEAPAASDAPLGSAAELHEEEAVDGAHAMTGAEAQVPSVRALPVAASGSSDPEVRPPRR